MPYVLVPMMALASCAKCDSEVRDPGGANMSTGSISNDCLREKETLEQVVTFSKDQVNMQLAIIFNLNIIHQNYVHVDFETFDFDPLPVYLQEKLDSNRKDSEDEIAIPNDVEDQWIKSALKLSDGTNSQSFVRNKMNKYKGLRNICQLEEFNTGLLGKLKANSDVPLSDLSVRNSLDLVFRTVAGVLEFREVDDGRLQINGVNYNAYTFDNQVATGIGDCSIYAALATYAFELLKRENVVLQNIYVGSNYFGVHYTHAWTQVYFRRGDNLYITSVDLSREGGLRGIDHFKETYLSENHAENLLKFWWSLSSYRESESLIKPKYKKAREEARHFHEKAGTVANFEKWISLLDSRFE